MPQDTPTPPAPIDRIQGNLLARGERRLLTWICERLPAWVAPDMLTAAAMVGACMIFAGYAASNWHSDWLWLSIAGYLVHWFGDSTDGSLARYRQIERPRYGYFLDHSCDGFATTLILTGIGLTAHVAMEAALLALAGYLLMAIHAFLSVRVMGELRLSFSIFGPTELRLILVGLTLAMLGFGSGPLVFGRVHALDAFVGFAGLLLVAIFMFQTAMTARRLAVQDPSRNDEWKRRVR